MTLTSKIKEAYVSGRELARLESKTWSALAICAAAGPIALPNIKEMIDNNYSKASELKRPNGIIERLAHNTGYTLNFFY